MLYEGKGGSLARAREVFGGGGVPLPIIALVNDNHADALLTAE